MSNNKLHKKGLFAWYFSWQFVFILISILGAGYLKNAFLFKIITEIEQLAIHLTLLTPKVQIEIHKIDFFEKS